MFKEKFAAVNVKGKRGKTLLIKDKNDYEVKTSAFGHFAIFKDRYTNKYNSYYWNIIHIPTNLPVMDRIKSREDALKFIEFLLEYKSDWGFDDIGVVSSADREFFWNLRKNYLNLYES
jgi:hypothetical protein